jgi:integrase/recombinase XerD
MYCLVLFLIWPKSGEMRSSQSLPEISIISLTCNQPILPKPPDFRVLRAEEFLKARSLSANSQRAYRRELERFLAWTDKAWADITPRNVTQFKTDLLKQGLKRTSVNRAIASLKSFFTWFHHTYPGSVHQKPTVGVAFEKVPLPEARDLSPEQVEALFAALDYRGTTQLRDTAILSVLTHGLRANEVCGLNVADYDGIRLHIRQAKDDSTGTVPMNQQSRANLDRYLAERKSQGLLHQDSPLFVSIGNSYAGQRLGYQGLYLMVKDIGTISGIDNLTPHRLRHTFATMLMLEGVDRLHGMTLTRHKDEKSYRRYTKRALQLAAEQAFYQAIGENHPEG